MSDRRSERGTIRAPRRTSPAFGGYTLVRPQGGLVGPGASAFRCSLADLTPGVALVIDLSEISFIDASGLGAIVGCVWRATSQGSAVAIACPSPVVARVLRSGGLSAVASISGALDEAAAAVGELSFLS